MRTWPVTIGLWFIILGAGVDHAYSQSAILGWVKCRCPWGVEYLCGVNTCRLTCEVEQRGPGNHAQCLNPSAGPGYSIRDVAPDPTNGDLVRVCSKPGIDHQVGIVGRDRDLIWIFSAPPQRYLTPKLKDRLQDGEDLVCGEDVLIGGSLAAVRFGADRDLVALYGIRKDGEVVRVVRRIQDGQHHGIWVASSDGTDSVVVKYGEDKDILVRFCFNGKTWLQSVPAIGLVVAGPCVLSAVPAIPDPPVVDTSKAGPVFGGGATRKGDVWIINP